MQCGRYRKKATRWSEFLADKFKPHISERTFDTCGSGALSLLTGIAPDKIDKSRPRGSIHWFYRTMYKFLRSKGYRVREITRCDMTKGFLPLRRIQPEHVVLLVLDLCQDMDSPSIPEASYFVVHRGRVWHNFEAEKLSPLLFLNHPIFRAALVVHRDWRSEELERSTKRSLKDPLFVSPDPKFTATMKRLLRKCNLIARIAE